MVIIFYQILTEHVARFRRWRSLKAYAILNALEIVFWAAVVFLTVQANVQICVGVGCILSWIACVVAVITTYGRPTPAAITPPLPPWATERFSISEADQEIPVWLQYTWPSSPTSSMATFGVRHGPCRGKIPLEAPTERSPHEPHGSRGTDNCLDSLKTLRSTVLGFCRMGY